MNKSLKLLIYENQVLAAKAVLSLLTELQWEFNYFIVTDEAAYAKAVLDFVPDCVLYCTDDTAEHSFAKVLRPTRKKESGIPVIVLSATESAAFIQTITDSEVIDYVSLTNLNRLPLSITRALHFAKMESEKAALKKTLKANKSSYDAIFLKGPLPKWIYDLESLRFLEVNEAAIAKYGYSREEFLEMTIKDIRPLEELPLLIDYFKANPTVKGTLKEMWRHRKKNGEVIPVEVTAHDIKFGHYKARMVSIHDISDKANAERKALQTEANLKIIFDNTSEGFLLLDEKALIVTFNNSAEVFSLIKKRKRFQIGESIYDFIEPHRKPILQDIIAKAMTGEKIIYERSYPGRKGTEFWMEFMVTPVYVEEQIKGVCITGRNINERKRVEKQREFDRNNLKALINNTRDSMWSIDKKYALITSNEAFNQRFKMMTGKEAAEGVNVLEGMMDDQYLRDFKEYYQRAFGGETFTITKCHEKPQLKWLEVSFYPIYNNEKVIGAAIFSRDVTERKQSEEERKMYTQSLEEMLFKISHKLRVPIANLLGLGDIAASSENTPEDMKTIMGFIKPTVTFLDDFSKDLTRFIEGILIANNSDVIKKK